MGKFLSIHWLSYALLLNLIIALIIELCLFAPCTYASKLSQQDIEDNEFAEFEGIEDDSDEFIGKSESKHIPSQQSTPQPTQAPLPVNTQDRRVDDSVDGIVEDDDDEEFEMVRDDDDAAEKPYAVLFKFLVIAILFKCASF